MSVRFNAPPGWQVPPGFRPEAGWAPDPAWPPAPPGWEYWIEDSAPPRVATRAERRSRAQGLGAEPPAVRAPAPADATTVLAPVSEPLYAGRGGPDSTIAMGSVTAPDGYGYAAPAEQHTAAVPPLRTSATRGAANAPTPPAAAPGETPAGPSRASSRESSRGASSAAAAASAARAVTQRVRQSPAARPGNMLLAGVAVAFLALGCILGVMVSVVRTSDATQAITNAERAQREARDLEAAVDQERDDLKAMRTELEEREKGLRERETDIASKESELTSRQQQLDQQQQEQEQTQPGPGQGGAWFYWDCNAARAAGAAPIPQDQPAYRGALDPNGNGVACEDGE